jgi:gliding motility-associated-like protein
MKKLYLVLFYLFLLQHLVSGQNSFIKRAGSGGIDEANDVIQLTPNKTISTGFYSEILHFGGTPLPFAGADDGFIACQNEDGQFIWALGINGPSSDKGLFLAKSPDGFIYLGGTYTEFVSIGTTSISANPVASTNQDIFIAKIDQNGAVQWVETLGGEGFDDIAGLTVTNQNKIWLTVRFLGNTSIGGSAYTSSNLLNQNVPGVDATFVRMSAQGDVEFSRVLASPENERMSNLVSDDQGNIYTTVHSITNLSYGATNIGLSNQTNGVLLKINSNGNLINHQRIFAPFIDVKSIDVMAGRVSIGGDFGGVITFPNIPAATPITNQYLNKIFTATFETQELELISHNTEGSNSQLFFDDLAYNSAGNLWVAGRFRCRFESIVGANESGLFNNVGFSDAFVALYQANTNNQRLYKQYIGSEKDDAINGLYCKGLITPIIAGYFQEKLLFNTPPLCSNCGTDASNSNISYCNFSNYNQINYIKANGNRDIMVGNIFSTSLPVLDLYDRADSTGCNKDILQPIIYPNEDSLFNCDSVLLTKDLNLIEFYADSIVNWHYEFNGTPISDTIVHQNGLYEIVVESVDGCRTFSDSVYLVFEQNNQIPEISVEGANIFQTTNEPCPYVYTKLFGDSATINGTSISSDSIIWEYQQYDLGSIEIVSTGSNTISILNPGNYIFTRITPSGCSYTECIKIVDFILIEGGICGMQPNWDFRIFANGNLNDTIYTCPENKIELEFSDSLEFYDGSFWLFNYGYWSINSLDVENPQSTVNNLTFPMLNGETNEPYPRHSILKHKNYFFTETEGWVLATICILSHPNAQDTVFKFQRRFYVKFNPNLAFNVSFSPITPEICPGDTLDVSFSTSPFFIPYTTKINGQDVPGGTNTYSFYEPGSISLIPQIPANIGGVCPSEVDASVGIVFKNSPSVLMTPENGLKCPNATVELDGQPGSSFEWFGPGVPDNYSEDSLLALFPGFYMYHFNDIDGCPLLSSKALVRNISATLPESISDTVRCGNQSVYIGLDSDTSLHWTWLPPLSGTNYYNFINSAGNYAVTGRVCETIDTFYFDVAQGIGPAFIQFAGKDTLCQGDTLTLFIESDAPYMQWSTGNTNDSILVSTQSNYSVTVSDDLGCIFTDFQNVPLYNNPSVPQFIHQPACPGVPLTVFTNSNVPVHWSVDEFSSLLNVGTSITLDVNQNNQAIGGYARNSLTGCRSAYAQTNLLLNSITVYPAIQESKIFCEGDSILITPEETVGISTGVWTGPNQFIQNAFALSIFDIAANQAGTYVFQAVLDSGYCTIGLPSNTQLIQRILDPPIIDFPDSLCAGAPIFLNTSQNSDYEYSWTAPNNPITQGISVYYMNSTPANSGFYYLTSRDSNCVRTDSFNVFVSAVPPQVPVIQYPERICKDDTLFLYNIDSLNTSGVNLYWIGSDFFVNNSPNSVYIPHFSDDLNNVLGLQLGVNNCLSDVVLVQTEVLNLPVFALPQGEEFCEGDVYYVSGPPNMQSYFWHNGASNQTTSFLSSEDIQLNVVDSNGCTYYAMAHVEAIECDVNGTPNTFSPNGDNINDNLIFTVEGGTIYEANIFTRWGLLVKKIGPEESTWDGTDQTGEPVTDGTYFYTLKVKMINDEWKKLEGFITIFR